MIIDIEKFCFLRSSDIYGDFYENFYHPTLIRGAPYLVGIILGYQLHLRDRRRTVMKNVTSPFILRQLKNNFLSSSLKHPRNYYFYYYRIFMWIFAYMTMTGPYMTISTVYDIIGENVLLNSMFLSTVRTLWGISTAWLIYECHCGRGGFMNRFLSNTFWMPIGKLGLSLYLVHPVIQYNFASSQETPFNLEAVQMVSKSLILHCRKIY